MSFLSRFNCFYSKPLIYEKVYFRIDRRTEI